MNVNVPVTNAPDSPDYIVDADEIGPCNYLFTYAVIGKGTFPFDMLRHDGAYPADTTSALNIGRQGLREVRLFSHGREGWLPTFARWQSFGWCVKSTAWEAPL